MRHVISKFCVGYLVIFTCMGHALEASPVKIENNQHLFEFDYSQQNENIQLKTLKFSKLKYFASKKSEHECLYYNFKGLAESDPVEIEKYYNDGETELEFEVFDYSFLNSNPNRSLSDLIREQLSVDQNIKFSESYSPQIEIKYQGVDFSAANISLLQILSAKTNGKVIAVLDKALSDPQKFPEISNQINTTGKFKLKVATPLLYCDLQRDAIELKVNLLVSISNFNLKKVFLEKTRLYTISKEVSDAYVTDRKNQVKTNNDLINSNVRILEEALHYSENLSTEQFVVLLNLFFREMKNNQDDPPLKISDSEEAAEILRKLSSGERLPIKSESFKIETILKKE